MFFRNGCCPINGFEACSVHLCILFWEFHVYCMSEYFFLLQVCVLSLTLFRSETKIWSPLSSEDGKTNPYKMNLASEPQVCLSLYPTSLIPKILGNEAFIR